MNVQVESQPNCLTTLRVEVPPERVQQERTRITRQFGQQARLPGFRPGKAPAGIIAKKFQKEIQDELTRHLLSGTVRDAINEQELNVLNVQNIDEINFHPDDRLTYTATVVTSPEFQLPDYKSLKLEVPSTEVDDDEVDEALESVRQRYANYEDVEARALEFGDFAVLDFEGAIEGRPVAETAAEAQAIFGKRDNFWLMIEEESFLPDFCPQIVGMKPGETQKVSCAVPDSHPFEELRGKTIDFEVTLREIKKQALPELDDAFAGRVAEGKTMDELRQQVREELRALKERGGLRRGQTLNIQIKG